MRLGELFSEMGVFSSVLQEDSWRSYIWSIECNDRRIWISCVSYEFTTENIEDCAISALNFSHSTNNVLWFVRSHRWGQNFSSLILRNALLVFCRYPSFFFFRTSSFGIQICLIFGFRFKFFTHECTFRYFGVIFEHNWLFRYWTHSPNAVLWCESRELLMFSYYFVNKKEFLYGVVACNSFFLAYFFTASKIFL